MGAMGRIDCKWSSRGRREKRSLDNCNSLGEKAGGLEWRIAIVMMRQLWFWKYLECRAESVILMVWKWVRRKNDVKAAMKTAGQNN